MGNPNEQFYVNMSEKVNGEMERNTITVALRFVKSPIYRFRTLWLTIAWALVAVLFVFGIAFGIGGFRTTVTSKPYAVISHQLPGGMYTHGWIMVGLATWLFYNIGPVLWKLPETRKRTHIAVLLCGLYGVFTSIAFCTAPMVGGAFSLPAAIWWMFGVVVCAGLYFNPPPTAKEIRKQMEDDDKEAQQNNQVR